MILGIDVGNTNVVIGGIDKTGAQFLERLTTTRQYTDLEFAVAIRGILDIYQKKPEDFDGAIVSSVVPEMNGMIAAAIRKVIDVETIIVNPDMNMQIHINTDNKKEVGSDLIVGCEAATREYPVPLAVIDMGTATTIFVIDEKKELTGGIIHPGIRLELESLCGNTALLPSVNYSTPDHVIGKNTPDCMLGGVFYGHAGMIDGILDHMEEECGSPLHVIATGGLAGYVIPLCKHPVRLDDSLLLRGLYYLYEANRSSDH